MVQQVAPGGGGEGRTWGLTAPRLSSTSGFTPEGSGSHITGWHLTPEGSGSHILVEVFESGRELGIEHRPHLVLGRRILRRCGAQHSSTADVLARSSGTYCSPPLKSKLLQ